MTAILPPTIPTTHVFADEEISSLHQSPSFYTISYSKGGVLSVFKLDRAGSELYLGGADP